jgi:phosphate transport system substrate-binding protein
MNKQERVSRPLGPAGWLMAIVLAAGVLAFVFTACGGDDDGSATAADTPSQTGSTTTAAASGEIAGAGASSQEAAMQAWIATFQGQNPDATVTYDPIGSGGGREQFIAGGTSFGGTDAALDEEELAAAAERCGGIGNVIEIPAYISPIAVAYNLDGVDELNLSPETLARVFKGEITAWNDSAIAAENPDRELPDQRITVVHRSDESGTTENFTDYLSQAAGKVWTFEVSGDWPVKGGEAAQGTSGVVSAIRAGSGTIGYADLSQVGDLSVANIGVGNEFVAPSAEAAAQIVDISEPVAGGGRFVHAYELDRDTAAEGIYPISLISYEIACTRYDSAEEAELVKAFLGFLFSEEGQQAAAGAAGSAPISAAVRAEAEKAVAAIGQD